VDTPILQMKQICKSFNGISVLNNVHFELCEGEVHALMGGNGAGKSTLMKILTGVYERDSGSVRIHDTEVQIKTMKDAVAQGISMIFQEFSLVPTLTVAQNIFLAREPRKAGFIDDKECIRLTRELLKDLNMDIHPEAKVGDLGVGYWQMTEIAKALSQKTKILVMDEPTSSLTKSETEILFQLIDKLKSKGISIIYISHRMDEIFQISDRITILGDGKNIVTIDTDKIDMDTLIQHISGKSIQKQIAFGQEETNHKMKGTPVLEVKNLISGDRVNGVSFQLYPGEVLGIAGLMGSGRTETLRALFGIDPVSQGEILLKGQPVTVKNPKQAIELGLAFVPEDRRMQGLVLDHSVKENTLLPLITNKFKSPFIDDRKGNQITKEWIQKLNIKTDSIFKTARLLSGGNQQKIVFAKWLATLPDILLLDEPTIGVDIGAKTEIIEIVRQLADSGKSIVLVSSELAELIAASDRIIIFKKGKVTGQLLRSEISSEEDLEHAIQSA
jgi:ribose transport system ATP-binding protein